MNISLYNITKQQTSVIKGMAILLIVFHNTIYQTTDIGFNEMNFDSERFVYFLKIAFHNPQMTLNAFFSFFGHFGIQIFIFISGYGLTKKYYNHTDISYKSFLKDRLAKIYFLMLFGIVVFTLIFALLLKERPLDWTYLKSILLTVTTLRNFSSYTVFVISGPWWFFGLIIQLYLLFPLFFKYLKKNSEKGYFQLTTVAYILLYIAIGFYILLFTLYPDLQKTRISFFSLFIGHIPEFLFGMAIALFPRFVITPKILGGALIIFILSNLTERLFPFSFLAVTILIMTLCYYIYTYSPPIIMKTLLFIGKISMFIFLFNAPIRNLFFLPYFKDKPPLIILAGSFGLLIVVILFSYIMYLIYNAITPYVFSKKNLSESISNR
ncbi:acyltransferase [Dysgonomonas sp. 216]|uniref:acyltransferase family protein n=1 Tax=Dysgonomonas sp. 216 TaxID=2302934 RepID=UPI0013D3965E|nr:acyltransferase [Dysgonomonas sp. 216]NDW18096.1 acyltransferase [Dysgonomonas sp. 216]